MCCSVISFSVAASPHSLWFLCQVVHVFTAVQQTAISLPESQSHWALVHHHLPLSVELARSASQVGLVRIIMLPHSHSQTFLNVMAEWNRPGGRRVPNNSELRRGQRLERRFLDTFQTEALRHLFLSQSLYHRMFLL